MKKRQELVVRLEKIVSGGQTIADVELSDGVVKKAFVWGGLPNEKVKFTVTKKRARIYEGVVSEVLEAANERVEPRDQAYLSTSPWQIYDWNFEFNQKAELIRQAFLSQKIKISSPAVMTDGREYGYRNKMEFAWWWNKDSERVELAHYARGTKGKIATSGSSLARDEINQTAGAICELVNRYGWQARELKTLLLRANQNTEVVAQLYVTNPELRLSDGDFEGIGVRGLEVIYSNPKSPASVISERLQIFGEMRLIDRLSNLEFSYPAESFFQINLPLYQMALDEIKSRLLPDKPVVDLYSGVGTIGLNVAGGRSVQMVEINPAAVEEMRQNIRSLGIKSAEAVLAPAEDAVDYIVGNSQLIVDPPRAGLHQKVIDRILDQLPERVIYLSCNVVTQARDVALLSEKYSISEVVGFNFFPKTPHIENLVVLDLK